MNTTNVLPLHSLRGASLEAFKRAGDIIETHMRKPTAIYPRIHLSKCQDCAGTGRRNAMRNGVVTQYECGTCFGHGDRLVHA